MASWKKQLKRFTSNVGNLLELQSKDTGPLVYSGTGDPVPQTQVNIEEEALRTEGYSKRATPWGGDAWRFKGEVLAKQLLAGKGAEAIAVLSKSGPGEGKNLYGYLMQRQAEMKAGGTTPKTSVAPLLEGRNEDMSKALDKATALLNSLKSGKTLLG